MDEFISNFNKFKDFLYSDTTQIVVTDMCGINGESVLKLIKQNFEDLNLNNSF